MFKLILPMAMAAEIRNSAAVNKTLITDSFMDPPVKFSYSFYTSLEVKEDGSSQSYLYGDISLVDLNTYYFSSDNQALRMSVAWENPMENGYDIINIDVTYNMDESKAIF
jgi:hypothetical protein